MILVTGAAGKTGQAVLRALQADGQPARGLVRNREQATSVEHLDAVAVIGDLLDAASLARAMRGVDAVYLICPNVHPHELEIIKGAIKAAQVNGVKRIVYHSVLFPQIEAMPHHWLKLQAEEALIASGLGFTILQPASYMQNVFPYLPAIAETEIYSVPYSVEAIFTPVDLFDVAAVAAKVLTETTRAGSIYQLAGPQSLSSADMAKLIGEAIGRNVTAGEQSLEDWVKNAQASKMPAYAVDTLAKMFAYYDRHGFAASSQTLSSLLGRPPTTFAEVLSRD